MKMFEKISKTKIQVYVNPWKLKGQALIFCLVRIG